jgi:DNA-binding SARP family transcriptional activator
MDTPHGRPEQPAAGTVVHLLGPFRVTADSAVVELPGSTHRLVAFLALRGAAVDRAYASACLWLDKGEGRAQANLRSALWRLRCSRVELVHASPSRLALAPGVAVDTEALLDVTRALVDDTRVVDVTGVDERMLSVDLLPNWYDDFVEVERERFRQLRLHALEALSARLVAAGRHAAALQAALTAVAAAPLRESAHRAVMTVHLAEGNTGEALRQFTMLVDLLQQQLGIQPSDRTWALVSASAGGREAIVPRPEGERFATHMDSTPRLDSPRHVALPAMRRVGVRTV